jgi:hypothetical protein
MIDPHVGPQKARMSVEVSVIGENIVIVAMHHRVGLSLRYKGIVHNVGNAEHIGDASVAVPHHKLSVSVVRPPKRFKERAEKVNIASATEDDDVNHG